MMRAKSPTKRVFPVHVSRPHTSTTTKGVLLMCSLGKGEAVGVMVVVLWVEGMMMAEKRGPKKICCVCLSVGQCESLKASVVSQSVGHKQQNGPRAPPLLYIPKAPPRAS